MVSTSINKFAVLLAGHGTEYTERTYGGYGPMVVRLLKDPGETWTIVPVIDGVFPSKRELDEYRGFVVTGSRHDAHGDEPWIESLCDMLLNIHQERKKILGLCFGHQVLSRALGGVTGRAEVGWEVGLREVSINDNVYTKPYGKGVPRKLRVLQSHRDQVLELPPGGVLLGSSERTPVEMFAVEDHILGIQGHPEFTKDVLLNLIENRQASKVLSMEEATEAKATVANGEADEQDLQRLCKSFLKD